MAYIVNTNIENQTNGYLLDAKNVKGTYVVVANTTERDALPVATRVEGSLCYCQLDDTFYIYNGSSWVIPSFTESVEVEAITEEEILALFN